MFNKGDTVKSAPRRPELNGGRHWRAKLGFILMSTDLAAEADFFDMVPEGVAVHITRLKSDDFTTNETLSKHIETMADAASRIQPDVRPDVISYSCTSGSIVIGEDTVMAEIRKGAPYARPMTLVTGVVDALRELGVTRLVVGTPYLDEINTLESVIYSLLVTFCHRLALARKNPCQRTCAPATPPALTNAKAVRKPKLFRGSAASRACPATRPTHGDRTS